ncbi:unnamed protein product [Kuraishia capsulata CBS 1993]|uniref:Vacuolar protein sorting-associated protein 68 n=1 Tax=Kuraishia capsulata CBS 1993 TaxID=1382522 RepID=W6MSV9_9ASCO|nr:uncharacterized protein KUCA_T00005802001 [Kuraishia capsulata CBS 1993]CDK29809.1 unnamed protein product [Kuraishia capsulata CBS 1993]
MDNGRLFKFSAFKLPNSATVRAVGVYLSGALYAIGFWVMVDAAIYSKSVNASVVHVTFIDWIPAICSSFGMLIVNSIEKSRLLSSEGGFGSSSTTWQARLVLFLGFSLLAIGISGSFLVLILKFLVKNFTSFPTVGMGVSNVVSNACIMLSCITLWIVQNLEDDYSYSLAL